MCELACMTRRREANEEELNAIFNTKFAKECQLNSVTHRLGRCHDNFFMSLVDGLKGVKVSPIYVNFKCHNYYLNNEILTLNH